MESDQDYYVWGHQNDRFESQRLTHQHIVCTNIFGGLLQSSIVADLESKTSDKSVQIAHVACGNGIWVQEVATSKLTEQHNVQVTGFDMTNELFPLEDERPDKVNYVL